MSDPADDVYRHVDAARDALTVRRVFGEAYEAGDATVIPVARVIGGAGTGFGSGAGGARDGEDAEADGADAGSGDASSQTAPDGADDATTTDTNAPKRPNAVDDPGDQAGGTARRPGVSGGMGSFAACARPAGVFVIRGGEVTWKPAWSLNAAILGGQVLGSVVALATAGVLRARAKRARRRLL